jgi:WD40 repeat protein
MLFESKKHSAMVNAIAFSTDGKLMATGSDDRTAIIWEVGSGKVRRTLKGHDFTATSLAFSPGGDLLVVGSGNASVVLWDVATGKLNRVMR